MNFLTNNLIFSSYFPPRTKREKKLACSLLHFLTLSFFFLFPTIPRSKHSKHLWNFRICLDQRFSIGKSKAKRKINRSNGSNLFIFPSADHFLNPDPNTTRPQMGDLNEIPVYTHRTKSFCLCRKLWLMNHQKKSKRWIEGTKLNKTRRLCYIFFRSIQFQFNNCSLCNW